MQQKAIFITGAASGIGRATASLFHEHGWFVACCDINPVDLLQLEKELGDSCMSLCADVSDKPAIDAAMAEFSDRTGGRLDLMFNNAGIAVGGHFDDVPFEQIVKMINVNLLGVMTGIYAALPCWFFSILTACSRKN